MKRTLLLTILVAGCKGTLTSGDEGPGGVVTSDRSDPLLVVMTPERGTFAESPTVMVSGRATDAESGIASLTINGANVTIRPDGSFQQEVPLSAGLTILETKLTDRGDNMVRDVRAVLAGDTAGADQMVSNAVAGKIGPGAFTVLGQMVSRYANTLDLMSLIGNTRLVDEGGSCLGVEVDLRGISKEGVTMAIVPQEGSLGARVEVTGLHVSLRASYDVACIGGSSSIDIRASKMILTGDLAMALQGESMAVSVSDLNVSFEGFNLDVGGIPGAIEDLLDGKVESEASNAIEGALRGMIPGKANELLSEFVAGGWEVSIFDHTANVTVRPSLVQIDASGAMITLDSRIAVVGGEGAEFLYSPSDPPAAVMSEMQGFGIGLADDLANQLLSGLWAARALEQSVDLPPDHPGRIFFGEVPDRIDVELSLPPTIDADEQGNMKLEIGDLILRLVDTDQGAGTTAVLAISASVDFAVNVTPDGRLTLVTNNPRTWAQVVDQTEAQDPPLDADVVESLGGVLASQLTALIDEGLTALPIPIIGDAMATDAMALSGGGYVVVRANLTPPP